MVLEEICIIKLYNNAKCIVIKLGNVLNALKLTKPVNKKMRVAPTKPLKYLKSG